MDLSSPLLDVRKCAPGATLNIIRGAAYPPSFVKLFSLARTASAREK